MSSTNPAARDFAPWADPRAKPFIRIEQVSKRFGEFTAVDRVSLDIFQGEFFSLLGGSGCGKTTLLRMLAGFEAPSEGRVIIDGVDMAGVPPYRRPANMMFQSYALFPHMSVERNIGFGLRQDGVPRADIAARVGEVLSLVRMEGFAKRKPHQLSGGQRQRVALARSLVKRPKVLLLDEPLAALDKKLREQTQFELVNIQETLGVTFIIVTHDQEEAMTMSSRIAVMEAGRIRQIGTPSEIYEFPASRFVADFIGSVNLFDGAVTADEPDHAAIDCPDDALTVYVDHGITGPSHAQVSVAIRPEKMHLTKDRPPAEPGVPDDANRLRGVVEEIAYLGDTSIYLVRLAGGRTVRVTVPNRHRSTDKPITWDDPVWISWPAYAAIVLAR